MFNTSPIVLPTVTKRLFAVKDVAQFEPYYPWMGTVLCKELLRAVLAMGQRDLNFEAAIGIECATTDPDTDAIAPMRPTDTSNSYKTAVGRYLIQFDPNGTSDGNIDACMYWRIGIIYQATTGNSAVGGDVSLIASFR
jgi:hypothetical protein